MKNRALIAVVSAYFLICPLANATEAAEPLQVMLQGGPAPELRTLVENHGGTITHDLPIINAVGALLTPTQLEEVLESPLVERHIDDLSASEAPDEKDEKPCDVSGSVELAFDTSGIEWALYNKGTEPVTLESLVFSWPELLGNVKSLSLGDKTIDPALYQGAQAGSFNVRFTRANAPILLDKATLKVSFKSPASLPSDISIHQSDFELRAEFYGPCSAKLIPGYENNHENFYYSSVAGADALHKQGITGKGVTVAVLDSGLWEHEELRKNTAGKPRILARYDAITNIEGKEVFDESGHGTHLTSVIAHSGHTSEKGSPTGTYKGIAPDVNLVAVKAFDVEGQGYFLDIIRGVQWVVNNQRTYAIRVLNLSFAQRPRWHYWEDPINQAVMHAWAEGITVVAAAGNEGPEPMSIGSPGNLPYIITVGAVTDSWTPDNRDDDYIPDFSSRGPTPSAHIKPDVVAPGGHITGITRPGSSLTLERPEYLLRTKEFVSTGSSQASAVVSGIAAILLQLEPDLSPDDVKCKLISSAEPAINRDGLLAYSPFQQGFGYVNATRAVTLGKRGCGNPDLDIQAELENAEHFQGPATVDHVGATSLPDLEKMVSSEPSEKGMSKTRKWGVKEHIERRDNLSEDIYSNEDLPFDWQEMYFQEKETIEKLAREAPQ
jgi:serine protease AprX